MEIIDYLKSFLLQSAYVVEYYLVCCQINSMRSGKLNIIHYSTFWELHLYNVIEFIERLRFLYFSQKFELFFEQKVVIF